MNVILRQPIWLVSPNATPWTRGTVQRIRHHYAVVGSRPGDLLQPLLDQRFRDCTLTLLCPPGTADTAADIIAVATRCGRNAQMIDLPAIGDANRMAEVLNDMARQHAPALATLNVSGVDPLYALPASQAFSGHGHPVFAVEPDQDQLIWLQTPFSGDYRPFNVSDQARLGQHFAAHGLRLDRAWQLLRAQKVRLNELSQRFDNLGSDEIHDINRVASRGPWDAPLQPTRRDGAAVDWLHRQGFAITDPAGHLRFADHGIQHFCAGTWLEHRVFLAALPLVDEGLVQDMASGCIIQASGLHRMEFDVCLLSNNRLHVIECKAVAKTSGTTAGIGQWPMHRLRSLKSLRGLEAGAMLVSVRAPNPADLDRAANLQVQLTTFGQDNVTEALRYWLRQRQSGLPPFSQND